MHLRPFWGAKASSAGGRMELQVGEEGWYLPSASLLCATVCFDGVSFVWFCLLRVSSRSDVQASPSSACDGAVTCRRLLVFKFGGSTMALLPDTPRLRLPCDQMGKGSWPFCHVMASDILITNRHAVEMLMHFLFNFFLKKHPDLSISRCFMCTTTTTCDLLLAFSSLYIKISKTNKYFLSVTIPNGLMGLLFGQEVYNKFPLTETSFMEIFKKWLFFVLIPIFLHCASRATQSFLEKRDRGNNLNSRLNPGGL